MSRIAVLALQGAFHEHEQILRSLGAEVFEVRNLSDWNLQKDGLILPGGESTSMLKLMTELGLLEPVRQSILQGLPVFGTCAGLILLAKYENGERRNGISTMDIDVCRNAYGRQIGSFHVKAPIRLFLEDKAPAGWKLEEPTTFPMTFIRAPYINEVRDDAVSLAKVDGRIVAAVQNNQLVTAFHPEIDGDGRIHEAFLRMFTP